MLLKYEMIEPSKLPWACGIAMGKKKGAACRAEIEMLLKYDMIEPSKLPWACGIAMAKKKGAA